MAKPTGSTGTVKGNGSKAVPEIKRNPSMAFLIYHASSGRRVSVGKAMNALFCTNDDPRILLLRSQKSCCPCFRANLEKGLFGYSAGKM